MHFAILALVARTPVVAIAYEFKSPRMAFLNRSSLNLRYDRMRFEYDDFRDISTTGFAPGAEPFYSFDADVIRFFFSGWF